MSTKAKIGREWVKCQVVLQETGETLHLTFAPGQTKKKVTVNIDGRTDTGFISLVSLDWAAPPYDAMLAMNLDGAGVKAAKSAASTKPLAPPKPIPSVAVATPKPETVEPDPVPARPEEITSPVVQETASDTPPVSGARRGRKPYAQSAD